MADYTPPTGDAVVLALLGAYTPPAGGAVTLALADAGGTPGGSVGVAWRILAGDEQALAWKLCTGGSQSLGWRIGTRGGVQALAWRLFVADTQGMRWAVDALPLIQPGLYHLVRGRYEATTEPLRPEPGSAWVDAPRKASLRAAAWSATDSLRTEPGVPWAIPDRLRTETEATWAQPETRLAPEPAVAWRHPPSRCAERTLAWDEFAAHHRFGGSVGWLAPPAKRAAPRLPWGEPEHLQTERQNGWCDPTRHRPTWTIPWDATRRIQWLERWGKELDQLFRWERIGPRPGNDIYTPPPGDAVLLPLQCPLVDWAGNAVWLFLRFRECASLAGRRKAWFVMNTFSVVRLPELTPVPVLGLSLASDLDSWAWGVNLTLPDREALALVTPAGGTPREVQINVNGYVWTAVIENFEERREFGRSGFTVTGRSRSAYLAAPYAQARNYVEENARTAVQLAEAELSTAGWELVWVPPDWLVPAGALSYSNKTPLEAVGLVAAAVGGRIQSHRSEDSLRVLSRYPVSPWNWGDATPDLNLTDNLVRSLALRWEETPAYNGVYVSGQNQGVLVHVKRTGSDGTPTAPMLVDPLLTHVDAGTERGRVLLSGCGKRATVSIELPLLPSGTDPGLLAVGQLVEINDGIETWRGLVVSVGISGGRPSVRQTVSLERFYF